MQNEIFASPIHWENLQYRALDLTKSKTYFFLIDLEKARKQRENKSENLTYSIETLYDNSARQRTWKQVKGLLLELLSLLLSFALFIPFAGTIRNWLLSTHFTLPNDFILHRRQIHPSRRNYSVVSIKRTGSLNYAHKDLII